MITGQDVLTGQAPVRQNALAETLEQITIILEKNSVILQALDKRISELEKRDPHHGELV